MTDIIIECKGGVVQEITAFSDQLRVFVIDWDEAEEKGPGALCAQWPTQRGVESLAPESRALYEQSVRAK